MGTKDKSQKKTVLFVCVENSCRSQIAEALFNVLNEGKIKAFSAGSRPSGGVNPLAIKVLKEIGIDISGNYSKGLDQLPVMQFDYIVGMGCKDACPVALGKRHIEWQISDPQSKDIEFFRKTRDEIAKNVQNLSAEIKKQQNIYEK